MYNLTKVWEANNIFEIGLQVNDLSGGLYFTLAMLMLFIVYLAVFKKQNFKEVFVAGTFAMSIISVLLFIAGYVGYQFILVPTIAFFASIIIFYFVQR